MSAQEFKGVPWNSVNHLYDRIAAILKEIAKITEKIKDLKNTFRTEAPKKKVQIALDHIYAGEQKLADLNLQIANYLGKIYNPW
jgi:hypothetical protein